MKVMNLRRFALLLPLIGAGAVSAAGPAWWPQFRGDNASGSGQGTPPVKWDVARGYYRAPEDSWGYASSPVIQGGRVFVQCGVEKQSWLAAFDIKDGKEVWRTQRNNKPSCATPSI